MRTILVLFLMTVSTTQVVPEPPRLYTVRVGEKMGAIDASGKMVIPAEHSYLTGFQGGYCGLIDRNKFGFIDSTGKVVVPPKYEDARGFAGGLAWVATDVTEDGWKRYTAIDGTGREQFAPRVYKEVFDFIDGYAWVDQYLPGVPHVIDAKGRRIFPDVTACVSRVSEGLAAFRPENSQLWGYIDTTGKVVIKPSFEDASPFSEGLAPVLIKSGERMSAAYIKPSGETAFEIQGATEAWPFSEGRARVRLDRKYGLVDKTGAWKVAPRFWSVSDFRNKRAIVAVTEKEWGVVDPDGKVLVPFQYEAMQEQEFGSGRIFAWPRKGEGFFLDDDGNPIKPFDPPAGYVPRGALSQLFLGKGLNGYIDGKGAWVWKDR